jgi:hypothetical protein
MNVLEKRAWAPSFFDLADHVRVNMVGILRVSVVLSKQESVFVG